MLSQSIFRYIRPVREFLSSKLHLDPYQMLYDIAERRRTFSAYPGGMPKEGGLGLAFDVNCLTSLSQVGRDYVEMLKGTSIPFQVFDEHHAFRNGTTISSDEIDSLKPFLSDKLEYRLRLTVSSLASAKDDRYTNVLATYWEFESGFLETAPNLLNGVDCILAASDFCYNYFSKTLPPSIKAVKVRYPFSLARPYPAPSKDIRLKYAIPTDAFVAFFHFNYCSSAARKNPEGVIRAFSLAFKNKPKAWLVIKTAGFDNFPDQVAGLEAFAKSEGVFDRVRFINVHLSYSEILKLEASSDVYISLHRGEGFGIGMLEAMAVGIPVVATNYGGNTDFCKSDTAFMVDYQLEKADFGGKGRYGKVKEWAEPNVVQASKYLCAIYEDRTVGVKRAEAATNFINDFFSVAKFEEDMRSFISLMEIAK